MRLGWLDHDGARRSATPSRRSPSRATTGISAQLADFWDAWADARQRPRGPRRPPGAGRAGRGARRQPSRPSTASWPTLQTQAADEYAALTGADGEVAHDRQGDRAAQRRRSAARSQRRRRAERPARPPRPAARPALRARPGLGHRHRQTAPSTSASATPPRRSSTAPTVNWPQDAERPRAASSARCKDLGDAGGTIDSYRAELDAVAADARRRRQRHAHGGGPAVLLLHRRQRAPRRSPSRSPPPQSSTTTTGTAGGNDIAIAIAALRGGAADRAYRRLRHPHRHRRRTKPNRSEANAEALTERGRRPPPEHPPASRSTRR